MQTMGKKSKKSSKGNPKSEGEGQSGTGDAVVSLEPSSGDISSKISKFEEDFDNFSGAFMSAVEDIFGHDLVASGQAGFQEICQQGKAEGIVNYCLGQPNL